MGGYPFDTKQWAPDLISPVHGIVSVTPSDSTDVQIDNKDGASRAVLLGVAGDLRVTDLAGNTVTIVGLAAGIWHPMRVSRIWATGTAATDIFIGY